MWLPAIIALILLVPAYGLQGIAYPIEVRFQLDSVLSSYIAEWNHATLELENRSKRSIRCVPRVVVTKAGKILARTKLPRTRVWTISPGERLRLRGNEIWGELVFPDDPRHLDPRWKALSDTGTLTICIHVTDSMGVEHFTAPVCVERYVFSYQLPIPLAPVLSDTLRAMQRKQVTARFQWMPVLPPRPGTCYIVRCYALPDSLNIAEAVRGQSPLVERRICNATSLEWHTQHLPRGRYVWTIRAVDAQSELPIATSDGYSLPAVFTVAPPSRAPRPVHHHHRRKQ
ncbi:MAG: hypothetical protein KatS3mg040_0430 [Candidatus Kapaibacterium sp.]|nr:MAG: hypothetical protein KatS3mg040_0430 [Candidatus Kapabacteria bacterium]